MRTMPAGEFKAKCLAVMDEVQASGEAVIVTKRGKPVARVTPAKTRRAEDGSETNESIFGRLRHIGLIRGDIVSSDLSNEEWDRMFDEKWARFEKGSSQ
jgi:prevent-host-death family protein